MSKNNRKYREEKKEWRHFFTDAQLKTAERYVNNGKVRDFEENGLAAAARVTGKSVYYPVIQGAPTCYSEDWDEEYFYCTERYITFLSQCLLPSISGRFF